MYLYKEKRKNGRIRLSIVESYREPGVKYPRRRTIELLGFLDELEKEYDDPIAFFKAEIAKREAAKKQAAKEGLKGTISLQIDKNETLDVGTDNERNFGYVALSRIYHELEIDKFI
ncbi:MAG TPA: transposase, partial [Firmicutes bacterium]|nr:transposase [Bacillota bacterium]